MAAYFLHVKIHFTYQNQWTGNFLTKSWHNLLAIFTQSFCFGGGKRAIWAIIFGRYRQKSERHEILGHSRLNLLANPDPIHSGSKGKGII
jgi:hypothetical protein